MDRFQGKVFVGMGDFKQILPVVVLGEENDILEASIFSSHLWEIFVQLFLDINMRLSKVSINSEDYGAQMEYSSLLKSIGHGVQCCDSFNLVSDISDSDALVLLLNVNYFTLPLIEEKDEDTDEVFDWMYEDGFSPEIAATTTILCGTNKIVDFWNSKLSAKNPMKEFFLYSRDTLCEVDDPNNILKGLLNEDVLNGMNHKGVPPHLLKLKVNDICFITRNLCNFEALTNNTRVRILIITEFAIKVTTLGDDPIQATLPRIRFKFRLSYGLSFEMMRIQFPLRRAYAMTFNKCQGQTLRKTLLDVREPVFAHGQLYVAMSRVEHFNSIALLTTKEDIDHFKSPVVYNVVYKNALKYANSIN